jgi:FkbM family methyltransferase
MGMISIDVDDMRVAILADDDRMAIHIAQGDGYEGESLSAWHRIVKGGKVALDIGAYTGLYSIIAAKCGAEVMAFEPMPANRWRLGINCELNKCRVTMFSAAVSDHEGVAELHYNPKVPLTTGASLESGIAHHLETIRVTVVTVDALALTNVAAIKIDVEKHEPSVIRGALKTIDRDRPTMLIETLSDEMRAEVLKLLPNYEVAAILDGRNTLFIPR